MPDVSIELTEREHRTLLESAQARGQSLQDFARDVLLSEPARDVVDENNAMKSLNELLSPRIEEALDGKLVSQNVESIIAEAHRKAGLS